MRRVLVSFIALALIPSAMAAVPPSNAAWPEAGQKWIKNYRAKPDPDAVPKIIRSLSQHGSIKDPDTAGLYVGFLAGVLGANPDKAWALIAQTLPLPFEDQWIVIRALAYSGLPQWKDLMRVLELQLPERQLMAQRYIKGEWAPLGEVPLDTKQPATMDKVKSFFRGEMLFPKEKSVVRRVTFESNPDLIDTLWGIYFATGSQEPIQRIILLLPWAKDRDSVEKLTIGSMAKFTLASNAARDAQLLGLLKRLNTGQPKKVEPILREVIEAAETADTGRIGKEALAALEERKKKGAASARDLAWWGSMGEAAISFGCLGLAVAGQAEAAIPCVVGGALSTASLRYLGRSD
jgi:hypothetical protein